MPVIGSMDGFGQSTRGRVPVKSHDVCAHFLLCQIDLPILQRVEDRAA
jgi:hypothetical protein